jgi:hypothetical protein
MKLTSCKTLGDVRGVWIRTPAPRISAERAQFRCRVRTLSRYRESLCVSQSDWSSTHFILRMGNALNWQELVS